MRDSNVWHSRFLCFSCYILVNTLGKSFHGCSLSGKRIISLVQSDAAAKFATWSIAAACSAVQLDRMNQRLAYILAEALHTDGLQATTLTYIYILSHWTESTRDGIIDYEYLQKLCRAFDSSVLSGKRHIHLKYWSSPLSNFQRRGNRKVRVFLPLSLELKRLPAVYQRLFAVKIPLSVRAPSDFVILMTVFLHNNNSFCINN